MPLLILACLLLTLPVLALLSAWVGGGEASFATLAHLSSTVLPEYALSSLILAASVGVGVAVVGSVTAAAVSLFEFPGRKTFEWLLVLPLAMPAYVMAYAYTDTLQYSGPLQTALRPLLGREGALWPDVRSLGGAIALFIACLYPYVYLLARSALAERGVHLMEAARLLGAGLPRRVLRVALPMARPAITAGTALALMETLADYGVGAYFGLSTFTTGIFHAWLSMGDREAAAQLASLLLVCVAVLITAERRAQRGLRFAQARAGSSQSSEARPVPLQGLARWLAWGVCATPVAVGFVIPVLALLRLLLQGEADTDASAAWLPRFLGWCLNSFWLAGLAAVLATLLSLVLAGALRTRPSGLLRVLSRLIGLGYAVPGAVIAVGILLPAGGLQKLWPQSPMAAMLTATSLGAGVCLSGALHGRVAAVHRVGVCAHPGEFRRIGAPAGPSALAPVARRALAAAAPGHLDRRLARVRRRDEGAARHAGVAPLQQRHARRGGQPDGARRTAGRSRLALAGHRAGRLAARAGAVARVPRRPLSSRLGYASFSMRLILICS